MEIWRDEMTIKATLTDAQDSVKSGRASIEYSSQFPETQGWGLMQNPAIRSETTIAVRHFLGP